MNPFLIWFFSTVVITAILFLIGNLQSGTKFNFNAQKQLLGECLLIGATFSIFILSVLAMLSHITGEY